MVMMFTGPQKNQADICTDKKLKRGKTCYYKVRAYSKVNGKKLYGGFSAVKKITVK